MSRSRYLREMHFNVDFSPAVAIISQPRWIFKVLEITLAMVCMGLVCGVRLMGGKPAWFLFAFLTPGLFLVFTPLVIVSAALGEGASKPTILESALNAIGAVFYFAVGGCCIQYYCTFITMERFYNAGISCGVLSIVCGLLHGIDGLLPFRENISASLMHFVRSTRGS